MLALFCWFGALFTFGTGVVLLPFRIRPAECQHNAVQSRHKTWGIYAELVTSVAKTSGFTAISSVSKMHLFMMEVLIHPVLYV